MEKIYKVYEINNLLKKIISEEEIFQSVTVKGEISNFKIFNNYAYFSLKDELSVIKANCFSSKVVKQLEDWIKENNNESNLSVQVEGSINIYVPRGEYSINVKSVSIDGKGNIYENLYKSRLKLQKLGLFEKKRPLPLIIRNIGIITSQTSAAFHDMHNTISRRNKFCQIYLFSAIVQGEMSVNSIIKNIKLAQNYNLDVLIIARGGGSIEDLWAFNDEKIAHEIFKSSIITISGVGHEIDTTTIDFVVDKKAITPTAAAEAATPITMLDMQNELINNANNIYKNIKQMINLSLDNLKNLNYKLNYAFKNYLNNSIKSFNLAKSSLIFLQNNFLTKQNYFLNTLSNLIQNNFQKIIKNHTYLLEIYENKTKLLNPFNILKKGYSIVYNDNNKVVKSSADIAFSKNISIQTYQELINVDIISKDKK